MSILKPEQLAKQKWAEAQAGIHAIRQVDKETLFAELSKKTGLTGAMFPTIRETFVFPLHPGIGYCLTTYNPGNSKELPTFTGEPFPVLLEGTLEEIMQFYLSEVVDKRVTAIAGNEFTKNDFRYAKSLSRFGERVLA